MLVTALSPFLLVLPCNTAPSSSSRPPRSFVSFPFPAGLLDSLSFVVLALSVALGRLDVVSPPAVFRPWLLVTLDLTSPDLVPVLDFAKIGLPVLFMPFWLGALDLVAVTFGLIAFDKGGLDAPYFEELEFAAGDFDQLEPKALGLEKLVLGTLREVLILVSLVLVVNELAGNLEL